MIVEPVPTNPRSPARRVLRLVAVAVPLVLLVGIAGVGALGPRPAQPSPAPSSVAVTTPAPSERPASLADGTTTTFPSTWVGFRVRSVTETRAERQAGRADGILAVSGYLSYGSLPWTCADGYLDKTGCDGRALLADVDVLPTDDNGGVFGAIGPHLHPTFAQGVRAPAPAGSPSEPRSEPIPVVVLGRYTDPVGLACSPTSRDCGQGFAVERVVWVAGTPWGVTLSVDPAMGVEPNIPEIPPTIAAATDALGNGALPLVTSVLRPDLLGAVDPDAAAALPPIAPEHQYRPVTYVRGLVFTFDASQPVFGRDPAIGWVVLDAITGEVLARGGKGGRDAPPVGTIVEASAAPANYR